MVRRLALSLLLAATPAWAGWQAYSGRAHAPEDGRLLYVEQHLQRFDGASLRERWVIYRCPDGAPFARKRIDYTPSPIAPAFVLEDGRDGYREGLRWQDGDIELFVHDPAGEGERRARLAVAAELVADAGFDEFIRREWDRLLAGEAVALRFAIPARGQAFAFRVRHQGRVDIDARPAELFRLRLGGVLGWIAPHIDVAYTRDGRRLRRYEGLSNLRDGRGRQWVARIDFPDTPTAATPAEVERARREPLRACG